LKGCAFVTFDTEEHQSTAVKKKKVIMINGEGSRAAFALPRRNNSDAGYVSQQGLRRRGPRRCPRGAGIRATPSSGTSGPAPRSTRTGTVPK
jgi:hypothetical protein